MIDLSLVIPVYNDEKIIESLIRTCIDYFNNSDVSYEILLVDDGSQDRTAEIVRSCLSDSIRLISLDRNRGKGSAVRRGVLDSRGEQIFFTDSDLAYGLDVIMEMRKVLEEGADLVLGSRTLASGGFGSYPWIRTLASHVYSGIITAVSGVRCDTQCGIKGFRRDCALSIFNRVLTEGYAFDLEVILLAEKAGMTVREYPVTILKQGDTQVSLLRSSLAMVRDILRIRKRIRNMK